VESAYKTAERALLVLQAFNADRPLLGVTDLAQLFCTDPGGMSRLLRTIERRGFLQRDSLTGKYRLGWEILRLTGVIYETLDVRQVCHPYLHQLEETWDETATLCMVDGSDVVNVDQVQGHQEVRASGPVGRRTSIHSTAAGKALVAWLPESALRKLLPTDLPVSTPRTITDWLQLTTELGVVRSRGFSINKEESDVGLHAVSAPVRNHTAEVVAALVLSGPAFRLPDEKLLRMGSDVSLAADGVSRKLGYAGPAVPVSLSQ
jgi:DNA-binding IclR family transcriptional regulator